MPPFFSHLSHTVSLLEPGSVVPASREHQLYEPLRRLIGRGAASRVLVRVGADGVGRMGATELSRACDVHLHVAERIVSARETVNVLRESSRAPAIGVASSVAALPAGFCDLEVEVVLALALTNRHDVIATVLVAKGGVSSAAFAPRDLFVPLVRLGSAAFVLAHTHPSGNLSPSEEDIELTNRVSVVGHDLGIPLIDHLIVSTQGVLSFHEQGLLPNACERAAFAIADGRRVS